MTCIQNIAVYGPAFHNLNVPAFMLTMLLMSRRLLNCIGRSPGPIPEPLPHHYPERDGSPVRANSGGGGSHRAVHHAKTSNHGLHAHHTSGSTARHSGAQVRPKRAYAADVRQERCCVCILENQRLLRVLGLFLGLSQQQSRESHDLNDAFGVCW